MPKGVPPEGSEKLKPVDAGADDPAEGVAAGARLKLKEAFGASVGAGAAVGMLNEKLGFGASFGAALTVGGFEEKLKLIDGGLDASLPPDSLTFDAPKEGWVDAALLGTAEVPMDFEEDESLLLIVSLSAASEISFAYLM
jgi:hypothetical protein